MGRASFQSTAIPVSGRQREGLCGVPLAQLATALCDRHFGIGADGVLLSGGAVADGGFSLRIFNPDGSEAEKSGNGLRIHARYLWDRGRVGDAPFEIRTPGGVARCQVLDSGENARVEMGRASFQSTAIPVSGRQREVLCESVEIGGHRLQISALSVGNPHCVLLREGVSPDLARQLGPLLETHPLFPKRTNVQFVQVLGRHAIRVEIWERGAGYTLASGTSACAAAAVSCRLGHCDSPVVVHMVGGELRVDVDADFQLVQTGPVRKVAEGRVADELLVDLARETWSAQAVRAAHRRAR
jgi:diaminopimelate epimerase